ncbi:MAG: sodium:proton antiporter [Alphaproteobacteria bacterium]|nr:sodium:proton antiporter [Alphaproteobacteria bacterium]
MSVFEIIAIIMTMTALCGYLNYRYLKLSSTVGLMGLSVAGTLIATFLSKTGVLDPNTIDSFVGRIDFPGVLLHGMLSFLLFAGALHIDLADLKSVKKPVAILATVGVMIATVVTGTFVWTAAGAFGLNISYLHALLFGALIAPTDPIAVLAILKDAGISKQLYTKIGGESLFNDGIGVVAFMTILGLLTNAHGSTPTDTILLFLDEVIGGAALGLFFGWITYRMLKSIDEYKVEVLLTLALVTGGYVLAEHAHVSAPIFMVTAGLFIGNHGRLFGMSQRTRERLDLFWELIDEILNAVLFVLIGLEIIAISVTGTYVALGLVAIAATLIGRFVSIAAPTVLFRLSKRGEKGNIFLLTWGGLRGGLPVAMALSLPEGPEKNILVSLTYMVVLFSILVQGLTFKPSLKKLLKLP